MKLFVLAINGWEGYVKVFRSVKPWVTYFSRRFNLNEDQLQSIAALIGVNKINALVNKNINIYKN